jgi:hypothetical protein
VTLLTEAQFSERHNNGIEINSVERSPFRKADGRSADQEFPALYGIRKSLTYLEEPAKSESLCNIL